MRFERLEVLVHFVVRKTGQLGQFRNAAPAARLAVHQGIIIALRRAKSNTPATPVPSDNIRFLHSVSNIASRLWRMNGHCLLKEKMSELFSVREANRFKLYAAARSGEPEHALFSFV